MKRPPPKCPEASTVTFPELSYPQVMNLISRHCLPCTYLRFGSGPNHVVVLPEAWDELRTYTHYSKCHPANVIEMQLQGLGHIFVSNGCITVVVSHFIPIPSASASPTHTTIIKSADDLVTLRNLCTLRQQYTTYEQHCNRVAKSDKVFDPFLSYSSSQVVVFFHTHPDLGCFFSDVDHAYHRACSNFPAVSMVCDPIRKDFMAMVGIRREGAIITLCEYTAEPAPRHSTFARIQSMFQSSLRKYQRKGGHSYG